MFKMFKLKQYGTKPSTEIIAGLTTFFTMAYIIVVNPTILSGTPDAPLMEWGAVFLATIISAVIGTLIMGLFANVPYAQAPGMGLNAFFVYTVCYGLKFTWQQALAMVFLCGILNMIVTVTKLRRSLIRAIPRPLQHAISGGIGVFIAYIGLLDAGLINFGAGVPAMTTLDRPELWLFLIGLVLIIALLMLKVKGAILIGIVVTTLIGWVTGATAIGETISFTDAARSLSTTFGVIFTKEGLGSLFTGGGQRILVALVTIFAFSITDMFDTIGTFIGTGRRSGIFTEADERAMESGTGFATRMERALFADMFATSAGAICGTSNVTTYVESAAGIEEGGRTGLTSVVVAICLILSAFLARFVSAIPYAATGPALIIVGVMMASSFADVKWTDLEEAIPAFFAGTFMAFTYSITYGIAIAFIFHCVVKIFRRKTQELHPIFLVATALFVLNFVLQALI
jgi:AGZA family xanthine/uracil permease-like MFS transporter